MASIGIRYIGVLLFAIIVLGGFYQTEIYARELVISEGHYKAKFLMKGASKQKFSEDILVLDNGLTLYINRDILVVPKNFEKNILNPIPPLDGNEHFSIYFSGKEVCYKNRCSVLNVICPPQKDLARGVMCYSMKG